MCNRTQLMARRLRGHTSRRQPPINLLLPIHWVSRRLTCLVRAGEHLYHLASDGAPVRLPSQLRDAAFDSWTCIYGWPVQGCWPALSGDLDRDRTVDVAAADRARTTPLLANGDTAGTVRLVRYPCAQQARSRACAFHHVGPVARVCFTADDCALITIGRQDRAIVVWNVDATATVARGKQDSDEPPLAK